MCSNINHTVNWRSDRQRYAFTLIELLVTISVITLIIAISMPALASAKKRAHYARWQGYSHVLRTHPDLVAYFNFEHETHKSVLKNVAVGNPMNKTYESDDFNGPIDNPDWSQTGRFPNKPALNFVSDLYTRGIRIEPKMFRTVSDQISIVGWIKISGRPRGKDAIVDSWVKGKKDKSGQAWSLDLDHRDLRWRTYSLDGKKEGKGKKGKEVKLKASIDDLYEQWFHYAATADGEQMKLYINGQLRDSKEQSGLNPFNRPFHIAGAGENGTADKLDGIIDEIAISSMGLSEAQILQHYRMGRP